MSHRRNPVSRMLTFLVAAVAVLALTATDASAAKKRHLPTFTMANYSQLSNSPRTYKGAHVNVSGKVFATPSTGSKKLSAVQMWMDPDNDQYNTLVIYKNTNLKPQDGDYLHVIGTVVGVYKYKNSFGASDSAVEIAATSVTETDQAATEPPISSTGTTLSTCAIDQYSSTDVDITGSITNPSSVTYNYDITIEVLSGGVRVGTAEDFEDSVAPNQPTTWSTSAEITGGNGTVTCQLLSVSRTTPS